MMNPMNGSPSLQRNGSALVVVMITVAVLAFIAASLIRIASDRHRSAFESASWNESILAAEAGADLALLTLRSTLPENSIWVDRRNALSSPGASWSSNWGVATDASGNRVAAAPATGRVADAKGGTLARWYRPTEPLLIHRGEGSTNLFVSVIIDAPASLRQSSGLQWYRVRSTGMANLPFRRASADRLDNDLRQVSLVWDRRSLFVPPPFASRLIEMVVQPMPAFTYALITDQNMTLPGSAGVVDSFDSRDPLKSTDGLYDPAKRQTNGHVATNGTTITVKGTVYGDAATNGGTMTSAPNITGEVTNDFYKELPPVPRPLWTASPGTPTSVKTTATVSGGSASSPTRVKLSSLAGTLTVTGTVDVWVTGAITGKVVIAPGAQLRLFFEGDISMKGRDLDNQTNRASNAQLYGISPPEGQSRMIDIDPEGEFICAIYAPGHDMQMHGNPDLVGAFVTRSITTNGNCGVHYDEALGDDSGLITSFRIANWLEDVR